MRSRRPSTSYSGCGRRPWRLRAALAAFAAVAGALAAPALPASAAPAAASAHQGASQAAAAGGSGLLTQEQALAQALKTGQSVQVTSATTSSSTLTANPNGSFTLSETNMPVRAEVNGQWDALNADLQANADGTVSPVLTAGQLTLSGGGTGPLATMTSQGRSLSLTLPWRLPAPALSGATATYANVPAPGIDLQVTADTQGGFEDVLVVKDAAAAQSPALRSFSVRPSVSGGLVLSADSHGNITAASRSGRVFFELPAATMWDSTAPAATVPTGMDPAFGRKVDLRDGQPVASAASGPGEGARTAAVGTSLSGGTVTYAPDTTVLAGKGTVYPVYIDPPLGSVEKYWAQVDSYWPDQTYPKPNPMQVGYNGWQSPYFAARSFVTESVPSGLDGSSTDIESATMYLTDEYSPTCSTTAGNEGVQVWQTGSVSTSTDWDNQPAWDTEESSKSYVEGYDSSCPAASQGFDVTGAMTAAAHASQTAVTFGIRASSETDPYGWKQFSDVVTLTTQYDKPPNAPGSLRTSPVTACTASPPTTVGDGDVILYATLSDPLGSQAGSLGAKVYVTDDATGKQVTGSPFTYSGDGSGSLVTTVLSESLLKGLSGSSVTEFSWYATASDPTLTSPASTTCNFDYNPSSPGAPSVTPPATPYTIGTAASFTVTPNATGVTPTSYSYQVNGAAPHTVTANSSGDATISVSPTSGADALSVTAVSAGGNVGQSATVFFTAAAPANAADGDMTGDGIPDLVTPGGGSTGLAPGLWLARGQAQPGGTAGDGQVVPSPVDIGTEGDGIAGDYSPTDFTGTQVITGLFNGPGLQAALVYHPSGTYAGQGDVLGENGDGTVLDAEDSSTTQGILAETFTANDPNGDVPLQLANGYNADPNDSPAYPDLITVSGDAANGYYLEYYQNGGGIGSWVVSDVLSNATPDGTMDWNQWQIATMQEPSGAADMFLYNQTAGTLYLWQGLTVDDSTGTAGYTQYELSSSWAPGTLSELRAADITGTGPALWAVTTSGTVTAWITSGLAGTPAITAQPAQSLLSPTHEWRLGDGTSGTISTAAADNGTGPALPLTASSSGATWTTGDLFSPAASFNGSGGYMTGTSNLGAVADTSDYTISAWVKPAAIGGAVFAESDETSDESCMDLYLDTATTSSGATYGRWNFATTNSNATTRTETVASSGSTNPVHVGSWTHIAVTYSAANKYMELYVDGIPAASASPASVWGDGCTSFELAHFFDQGQIHAYFPGEIADVEAWRGTALTPTEIADLSGTPGYDLFPSDSSQYTSAASSTTYQWQTACGEMKFYQGQLAVKETCTGTTTATYGTAGSTSAVLTLQKDGNLVIYPNAADASAQTSATWAAGTESNTGDAMFLQPDGNLVIYGSYGKVLWKSGTDN